MTGRKPPGVTWQTWIDRQIEEGRERGAFDDLPGAGRPIRGLDRPRDELWWVRDKLKREGVEYLPPALAIRKEAAAAERRAVDATTEAEAREILEDINARIRHLNSHTVDGPPTTLMPLDVEATIDRWRVAHPHGDEAAPAPEPAPPPPDSPLRWERMLRWLGR